MFRQNWLSLLDKGKIFQDEMINKRMLCRNLILKVQLPFFGGKIEQKKDFRECFISVSVEILSLC